MKKILSIFTVVLVIFSLCGCSAKEAIASDKQEYMVSSLGFDNKNSYIRMILEVIIINSDDLTSEKGNELIIGTGNTVNEAFQKVSEKITQPLMFSHSGVIVVGSDITPEQLEEIFDFCYQKDEINLAAMFVSTENAEELLSCKAVSSVAVGYDIMGMVEVISEERGAVFENLFYEIESARDKPMKTIFMPSIAVEDEQFFLNGLTVFRDNRIIRTLNLQEVQALNFIKDSVTRGSFMLEEKKINVKSSKTTYDFALKDKLEITLNIRLNAIGDKTAITKSIENIFYSAQRESQDIFSLGNLIYYQSPKIWKKIMDDYDIFFKNASLKVNINE